LVLQNVNNLSGELSIASSNTANVQTAPEFPSESSSANTNSSSATANTTSNSAPIYSANSAPSVSRENDLVGNSNTVSKPPQPVLKAEESRDEDKPENLAKVQPSPTINQPTVGGVTSQAEKNNPQDDKEAYSKDDSKINQADKQKTTRAVPNTPKKSSSDAETTRQVSGKTFRKVGGTWFDSEYGTQKQISVRRGTNDYRKLDSGLRSIADQFSGTVVVLWKSKAYRIQ
jgi:hypothetical protein